jgi:hypothetical protein
MPTPETHDQPKVPTARDSVQEPVGLDEAIDCMAHELYAIDKRKEGYDGAWCWKVLNDGVKKRYRIAAMLKISAWMDDEDRKHRARLARNTYSPNVRDHRCLPDGAAGAGKELPK